MLVEAIRLRVGQVQVGQVAAESLGITDITPVCLGQIAGFGWQSYVLGLEALLMKLAKN